MRFIFPITVLCAVLIAALFWSAPAQAYSAIYTARNIHIEIESADMMTARDQALLKAQRHAVTQFVTLSDPQQAGRISHLDDKSLSRTVRDFSLRNERMGGGLYQADFMIRFDRARLAGLLATYQISLPHVTEIDLANLRFEQDDVIANVSVTDEQGNGAVVVNALKPVVILPVLDIGSRRVIWDEPNPWRDGWQKQTNFKTKVPFIIPLGDVSDLTDIPDGQFLTPGYTGKQPDLAHMKARYGADKIYILVARSQGAALNPSHGLTITVHEYDDKRLVSKGTLQPSSRPGYLFEDAVLNIMPQIDQLALGVVTQTARVSPRPQHNTTQQTTLGDVAARGGTSHAPLVQSSFIRATIPIPNLSAWVRIQQSLRRVDGVRHISTDIINPDSVTIRIETASDLSMLLHNIQSAGFHVQHQGNGHYILTAQHVHGA